MVLGSTCTLATSCRPPESVAVSCSSIQDGYSWSGAVKLHANQYRAVLIQFRPEYLEQKGLLDARVRDAAPPGLFARTMTLNTAGLMTLQGLGFTLAGAVAELAGPAATIAIAGGCGVAVVVWLLRDDLRSR